MLPILAAAIPTLVDLIPDAIGWFAGDKAEDAAEKVVGIAKSVTGIDDQEEALQALKLDPEKALEFKKAVLAQKNELDKLYLADRQNARDMQNTALQQDDVFSKRFIYYFASAWSLFAMVYLACITFIDIPDSATRFADTILGFLLGTIIAGIIQFFYGSSMGSKKKTEDLTNVMSK